MTFAYDEFNYTLQLKKGELLIETLTKFVNEKELKGGWVLGLGGLAWAELGFYDTTAQAYLWTRFDEPLELLNITGNISINDSKPFLHLHATVSDASQYARGGHVKEAEVSGTAEIFIHLWDDKKGFKRSDDKATGLKLLDL
jgi:predicted DNA-binding protein with PD1-like motif